MENLLNLSKDISKDYYAIIDLVANNPMSASMKYPVLVAVNIPPEVMEEIKKGNINIPTCVGTAKRAYLKVEEIIDFQNSSK